MARVFMDAGWNKSDLCKNPLSDAYVTRVPQANKLLFQVFLLYLCSATYSYNWFFGNYLISLVCYATGYWLGLCLLLILCLFLILFLLWWLTEQWILHLVLLLVLCPIVALLVLVPYSLSIIWFLKPCFCLVWSLDSIDLLSYNFPSLCLNTMFRTISWIENGF
jgi:hypothetical protein